MTRGGLKNGWSKLFHKGEIMQKHQTMLHHIEQCRSGFFHIFNALV